MKKSGFTLGEVAVTVAIVGFLAAIFLPVIKKIMPNQERLMFKKAYYLTERLVSELVNDEALYPEVDDPDASQFFGNTESVTYRGTVYEKGSKKFCELMAAKINKSSGVSCTNISKFTDGTNPSGTLTTADGMVWILPISNFADPATPQQIYVDVNGNKKPNCFYNSNTCTMPDRFTINVYQDGRVEVTGVKEIEYLDGNDSGSGSGSGSGNPILDNGGCVIPPYVEPAPDIVNPGKDGVIEPNIPDETCTKGDGRLNSICKADMAVQDPR